MDVILTPDQQALIRQAIADGRLQREEDAVREGLALWEERERRRIEFRSSLLRARAAQARVESREIAKQALRQLSAGFMERRPARMMADLAGAR